MTWVTPPVLVGLTISVAAMATSTFTTLGLGARARAALEPSPHHGGGGADSGLRLSGSALRIGTGGTRHGPDWRRSRAHAGGARGGSRRRHRAGDVDPLGLPGRCRDRRIGLRRRQPCHQRALHRTSAAPAQGALSEHQADRGDARWTGGRARPAAPCSAARVATGRHRRGCRAAVRRAARSVDHAPRGRGMVRTPTRSRPGSRRDRRSEYPCPGGRRLHCSAL